MMIIISEISTTKIIINLISLIIFLFYMRIIIILQKMKIKNIIILITILII